MVLTVKQRDELNNAIYEYLKNYNYSEAAAVFQCEADIDFQKQDDQKTQNILEKKWISIIRLQKKILELEQTIEQLHCDLESKKGLRKNLNEVDINELFPKLPAKHTLSGHRSGVNCLTFHPEFAQLASASDDATIKLWDLESGKFETSLKGHTGQVNYISFDPTGRYLASASSDLSIKIWDQSVQNKCIKTLHGHDHTVSCVEFLGTEELLSCSRDKTIKLWNFQTGFCTKSFAGHTDWVRKVALHQNLKTFASCSNDQNIIIWEKDQPQPIQTLIGHEHVIECVKFINCEKARQYILEFKKKGSSDKSELVLSGSRDKAIRLWHCVSGSCLFTFEGHDNWVRGVAFHHSSKFFYSCSDDKTIRIWDLTSGKCVKKIEAHNHFVSAIDSSPKYLTLLSASVDNSIKIWDMQ